MAKRQRTVKVDSAEVQGDGSFVEFRRYSRKERREVQEAMAGLESDALVEAIQAEVTSRLVSWDWVDDDDEPLPLPQSPDDYDAMLDIEVGFLYGTLTKVLKGTLKSEDLKN